MRRALAFLAAAGAIGALVAACAALQGVAPIADAEAQVACVAEAGTRAEGLACICAVRASYPAGPQCDAGASDAGTDGAK